MLSDINTTAEDIDEIIDNLRIQYLIDDAVARSISISNNNNVSSSSGTSAYAYGCGGSSSNNNNVSSSSGTSGYGCGGGSTITGTPDLSNINNVVRIVPSCCISKENEKQQIGSWGGGGGGEPSFVSAVTSSDHPDRNKDGDILFAPFPRTAARMTSTTIHMVRISPALASRPPNTATTTMATTTADTAAAAPSKSRTSLEEDAVAASIAGRGGGGCGACVGDAATAPPPNNMKLFDIILPLDGDGDGGCTDATSSSNNGNKIDDDTISTIARRRLEDLEQRLSGYLLPYFQLVDKYESVDMESVKAEILPLMERGCSGGMCPHVSLKSMHDSAAEGNVECHTVHNVNMIVSTTEFEEEDDDDGGGSTSTGRNRNSRKRRRKVITTLKLYYDDSAHLKRRPLNEYVMKNLVLLRTAVVQDVGGTGGTIGVCDGSGDGFDGDHDTNSDDDKKDVIQQMKIYGDVFVVAVGYYYDDEDGDDDDNNNNISTKNTPNFNSNNVDEKNNTNDPRINAQRHRQQQQQQQTRKTHVVSCYPFDIIKILQQQQQQQ